ncbi:MAG: RagB/SusD family nutrient uptake outer membrane protein [Chryseolinea sp.]
MKKILIAVSVIVLLSNCSDYLKEDNKTDVLVDDLYRTVSGFENLVNASYNSLRAVHSAPFMFESGTDICVDGRNPGPVGLSEYASLSPGEVAVKTFYQTTYQAIQVCNTGVYYAALTEQTSTLPSRTGELKFIRAYYYFLLAQSFGGVSLVTDVITTAQTSFERNSEEEIYDFIVSELNESVVLVDENPVFGRVGKRAVKHLLAKVHLTRGYTDFAASDDFTKAATLADEAINGYDLSSITFKDLFWPGKEKNNEVLFSIQYTSTSLPNTTSGSTQSGYFGPYHGGEGLAKGYPWRSYNLIATSYFYDLFNANDVRWEGTFMNVLYERYFDFYDKADKSAVKIARYYPQAWEVADTAVWRAADVTNRAKTRILPYEIKSIDPVVNGWEQPAQYLDNGIPAVRKFDDPTAGAFGLGTSNRDVYIARLAETYLIAAEAYLMKGDKATAMDRINKVKARAERIPGTLVLIDQNDVTIDEILDERARELFGEYHRWFDLKRTGKLIERVMLYNKDVRDVATAFDGNNGEKKILRPIPKDALDLNSNKSFPQNPAY